MFEFGSPEFSIAAAVTAGACYLLFVSRKREESDGEFLPVSRSSISEVAAMEAPKKGEAPSREMALVDESKESPAPVFNPPHSHPMQSQLESARSSLEEIRDVMTGFPSVMLADLDCARSALERISNDIPAQAGFRRIPDGGNESRQVLGTGRLDDKLAALYRMREKAGGGGEKETEIMADADESESADDLVVELLRRCRGGIGFKEFIASYPEARSRILAVYKGGRSQMMETLRSIDEELSLARDISSYEFLLYPDSWHYPTFMDHYGQSKYFVPAHLLEDRSLPVENALQVISASVQDKFQSLRP